MTLTAAYSLACGLDIGGIKTVHLANTADVSNIYLNTILTSHYASITMESGKVFYKIDFESASWTKNDDNSTVLTIDMGKLSQASRDAIQGMKDCGKCGFIAVITDANDTMWVLGYDEKDFKKNPLIVENATGTTSARGEDTENILNFIRLKNKLEEERNFTGTIPVT